MRFFWLLPVVSCARPGIDKVAPAQAVAAKKERRFIIGVRSESERHGNHLPPVCRAARRVALGRRTWPGTSQRDVLHQNGRDGALRRPGRVQRRNVGWRVTPLAFVPAAGRGRGRRSATSSTKMVGTARCAVRAAFSGATSDGG